MKFSLKTLAIGGAAALAGLSFAFTPYTAQAQSADLYPRFSAALEQLNLTPDQQAQLTEIRQDTRTQLESLLTPEQQEQFRTAMQQRSGLREAIAAMNLSSDQQTQLRSVFQSARQQSSAVLTEEQRQQVRDFIRDRVSERQQQQSPSSGS